MAAPVQCRMSSIKSLILRLHDVDAVKFGDFTLKSGVQSPVYFDLRVMVSYPQIMTDTAALLWDTISSCSFKMLCGVPYTALPIATLMSANHNIPMLLRRKESKGYGTKKLIEGTYAENDVCLIVEDVVSSGSSILETAEILQSCGIVVKEAVVLLNREQGGREKLAAEGITLHSVFTMSDILHVLSDAGKMSPEIVNSVTDYISKVRFKPDQQIPSAIKPKILSYGERSKLCSHPLSRSLFDIMEEKKTNLAFSADVTDSRQLLQLVDKVGPHICVLKTHVDILEDFSQDFISKLKDLASKHRFLIFEDRKFADIGSTVVHQFSGGLYRVSEWADIVNAHIVPGPGVVQGLKQVGSGKGCGCLLIAEMSSSGNMIAGEYTQAAVKLAEDNDDFVMGFISVSKVSSNPAFIHMTPGVQLQDGTDSLGQQYLTPHEVITNRGSDIIIVGRGIYKAADPVVAAKQFQAAGFDAYLTKIS